MLVDQVISQAQSDRMVAAVALAIGATGVEMPSVADAVADLDAMLLSEPRQVDRDELVLREALGLGRAS